MATRTRKVSSRAKLAQEKQIILPDDVKVVRESEVVEWVVDGNHSVTRAAEHFKVSQSVIRRILTDAGVKPAEQLTVWARPPSEDAVVPEDPQPEAA